MTGKSGSGGPEHVCGMLCDGQDRGGGCDVQDRWHAEQSAKREPNWGSPELNELVAKALAAFNALSPEEQAEHRREQAISWAYGNLTCTGRRPYITRELVAAEYDKTHPRGVPSREEFCRQFDALTRDIDDLLVARRFEIGRTTVARWRAGEAAPHPVGRLPILDALKRWVGGTIRT